ncbi:MAG TPA: PHP domain-containing protein [Bryobacteraceae bacterium]|jgi:DNA polymerase (family 10)|nr:PHP domain-containing protein [Bryobacteraceae bacterium]
MNARAKDTSPAILSNAEIADRLASLAQLLSTQKENPWKIKAYHRAAAKIRNLSESVEELVRDDADLTRYSGIGEAIASAIREIVLTGSLGKLDKLRAQASPELLSISSYPRLDPKRVMRVYKKLGISSVEELHARLESGEIEKLLGLRMAQHIRQGLTETPAMLLYRADDLRVAIEEFLVGPCGVRRAEVAGAYRRRVEVIDELAFVIQTDDFPAVVSRLQRYGGRTPLVSSAKDHALFSLPSGLLLRIQLASAEDWGFRMIACTGSELHLRKLSSVAGNLFQSKSTVESFPTESALYRKFGLDYIEPELREGHDEVDRAANGTLPVLVTASDILGELHAHSTSSDGGNSIEEMAQAAQARGYEYLGITDHSQSLKIARGVSIEDLWSQIRFIDKLNARLSGFRVLKSAEVDILADGSLDYPDDLLHELDYTVCSIHSRFALDKQHQTERILRAMDNHYFNILGHATGRLLLKRPGYEIDIPRVIAHARDTCCFFEINSSPDRLDLSAENARATAAAGVKIAISTDAHSTREFGLIRYGIDQGRRAGLEKTGVLNCLPWQDLEQLFRK